MNAKWLALSIALLATIAHIAILAYGTFQAISWLLLWLLTSTWIVRTIITAISLWKERKRAKR